MKVWILFAWDGWDDSDWQIYEIFATQELAEKAEVMCKRKSEEAKERLALWAEKMLKMPWDEQMAHNKNLIETDPEGWNRHENDMRIERFVYMIEEYDVTTGN